MASSVGMCNAALIRIGANEITSLTEDSEEARKCNARFQDTLDALLESHPWNFSIARATLAASATAPNHEWDYQYLLPQRPYCLRVVRLYSDYEYKIEGRYLLCNQEDVSIKYVKRVTDMNELSPMFRECFALYLGAELAYPLAGSNALRQELLGEFGVLIRQARSKDAQEETPDNFKNGSWFTSRGVKSSRYVVSRRYY
jgi:hypothetical protein